MQSLTASSCFGPSGPASLLISCVNICRASAGVLGRGGPAAGAGTGAETGTAAGVGAGAGGTAGIGPLETACCPGAAGAPDVDVRRLTLTCSVRSLWKEVWVDRQTCNLSAA